MFARSLTDQALWDAIMANPDDDAPRLVYADALQQRGEPLGDLIAIQCNPRYASDQAMRAHAADLVHANAERWKAELGLAASARVEYQRGLPYLTHVQTRLAELAILDRAPVEFVCFTDHDASVETARGLARDARLARIRALSISCSGPALRELLASPHAALRRLFVGNCTNDAARAVAEATMPGLESLLIEGWQRPLLDDTGIAALARARLPGLRTLWLRDLATTAATFAHIATSTFDRLEELAIQGYFETGPAALARSSNFAYLHTLDLGRNRLAGAELAALARSSAFPALHTLDLALNRITDAGILALAAGAGMPELASLDLGYATLSAGAVRVYANASRFAKLRKLSLRGVARGPEVAIAIAESPHATNLRELDLSGCKGRDEAAFAVARSPHLAGITTLAFGKNKVTHAGRQALVDRFGDRVTLDR